MVLLYWNHRNKTKTIFLLLVLLLLFASAMLHVKMENNDLERLDGRTNNEIRKILCTTGPCSQADGSAYLEQGRTKVVVSVHGPHDVKSGKSLHDRAILNCQFNIASFKGSNEAAEECKSSEMARLLKQTFESAILLKTYPNKQIDIFVEVLEADGSEVSASVNAATLALIEAGIQMRGTVCSCSVGKLDDRLLLDVTQSEASDDSLKLTLAMIPLTEQILMFSLKGSLKTGLEKMMDFALDGCKSVLKVLGRTIIEKEMGSLDLS